MAVSPLQNGHYPWGIGTIAAALKAKIPLIIISIIADQPWWGKIIERKKLGVHIPFRKLTTQKLLAAIEKTETFEIKFHANKMGEQINREDGLKKTIDVLEKYFNVSRVGAKSQKKD